MRVVRSSWIVIGVVASSVLGSAACRTQLTTNGAQTADQAGQPPYVPDSTIKDLMLSVVDPSADVVWLSVTTTVDETGINDVKPTNDEEWIRVRHGAVTLMEASNLLMMPGRRVARPGEKSDTPGVELEPEEMDVLIAKDRASWNMRALALHDAAQAALKAAEAHDPDKLFEIGEQIENACESCHQQYWYPNEKVPQVSLKTIGQPAPPSR